MRKKLFYVFIFIVVIIAISLFILVMVKNGQGSNSKKIHIFYAQEDKRSTKAKEYLYEYVKGKENIEVIEYEVWNNDENKKMLLSFIETAGIDSPALPMIVVGNKGMIGYLSDSVSGKNLEKVIESCTGNCDLGLEEIKNIEFIKEPTVCPIEKPKDENKGDDVC